MQHLPRLTQQCLDCRERQGVIAPLAPGVQPPVRRRQPLIDPAQPPPLLRQILIEQEQPLCQQLLAGQHTLAHTPAERLFLDAHDALEGSGLVQPVLDGQFRKGLRQRLGGHHPIEGEQFTGQDLALQRAPRHPGQVHGP